MCDTFVALGNSTADGSVVFGKNSDREPNEAHEIKIYPAADYAQGSEVQCTYISIPQAAHTAGVLLAKPFWIWGAEMGLNEHGVVIGNEALFTKVPHEKSDSLIGMDFLRLALERSTNAWEALYTITQLLETYGQAGNCGFTHAFHYHNSYLIADSKEAWVLETAGRQWAAERVKDTRSISNAATIGKTWDLASDDLVTYAMEQGWCRKRSDFHFAKCYSDFAYTTLSAAGSRHACTTRLLRENQKEINVLTAIDILRSHSAYANPKPVIDRALTGASVCMHAGAGPVRGSQSVGSMVVHLGPDLATAWVTATSAPCTGIFKPVWLDGGIPLDEPSPTGSYDSRCLWWRHEDLHRAVIQDYAARLSTFAQRRDDLEQEFFNLANQCGQDIPSRQGLSRECFLRAEEAEQQWLEGVNATPLQKTNRFYFQSAWKQFSKQAGMHFATKRN